MNLSVSVPRRTSAGGGDVRFGGTSSAPRAVWNVRNGISAHAPTADLWDILASVETARDLVSSPGFLAVVASRFRSAKDIQYEATWDPEDDSEIRAIVIPTTLGVDAAGDELSALRRELRIADVRHILAGVAVCLEFAA